VTDQQLADFIKSSTSAGVSKEEIYKKLLTQGVSLDKIETYFKSAHTEENKEDTQKKTIRIILTIGAILIGAGIFSFIASNWPGMPKEVKVAVIVVAMITAYSAGWYFKEKANLQKTGNAFILLGAIIYGAGIFLIGQIFNIRANWPDGFILWMLGVTVMAYAIESYPLFYLAIPLAIIAIFGHPFLIFNSYNGFLLTSSFLLLVTTLVTFLVGWLVRRKMASELKDIH
jgi:uncharacterized membrane protein